VNYKLGIAIPWREQPSRVYAFNAITNHYKKHFVDVPLYYGDFPSERWNTSGSRNIACEKAFADGCDVVAVMDADFFMHPEAIREGVEKAVKLGRMVIPFQNLYFLDQVFSQKLVEGELGLNKIGLYFPVYRHQVAGSNIITKKVFETLNGWDERFLGWGYEDVAFTLAHETLIGPVSKINNYAASLFHEDRDKELVENNKEHAELYASYVNDQSSMKDLIAGNRVNVS
jgi:hypothetical protein